MKILFKYGQKWCSYGITTLLLLSCSSDPMVSGLDPFAPMVFKEGTTKLPLNPPKSSSLIPFYVSSQTIFKFAVDKDSILIGADGVTRYTVVMTNPNGGQQIQYEGIRCDTFQWRLYGNLENNVWQENPLASWKMIQDSSPNRYQAALAQGALCNFKSQEKNINTILQSLSPNSFTGGTKPTNSYGYQN
jgi:hypothetical protein